jgi:two-component system chemotaxis sensor kinase CheA
MFYSGADPITLLSELRELGNAYITAHTDQIPPLSSLEPEHCYLWWEILLITGHTEEAVRDAFVFVADVCEVRVRLRGDQAAAVALFGSVPEGELDQFVLECEDHVEEIERDALALEKDPAARSSFDSLFRSVHSIKGNAGLLLGHLKAAALLASHPLQLLLRVGHGLESLLEPFRETNGGPAPEVAIQTALETCDAIRALLGSLSHNGVSRPVSPELLERLGVWTSATSDGQNMQRRQAAFFTTTSHCLETIAGCFRRMDEGGEEHGSVLEIYLGGLNTLLVAAQDGNCPELEEPVAQQLRILDAAMREGATLGSDERAILGSAFGVARSVLDRLSRESEAGVSAQPTSGPQPAARTVDRPQATGPPATIRVDQSKLDRVIRVVGELLVARWAFPPLLQKLNEGTDRAGMMKDLKEAGESISRIADELQTSVMSIRMLPVKTVFQKFPRVVRDLARSLGKEVRFVVEGEDIELDKVILEQIGDPLVHVIRNAVDHGLEPPEERLATGKEACGQLMLRARHDKAGGVVIEVSEDGRGLDADALKRKAIEKGLLTPEAAAAMPEEAAFELVFLPGLSTAAKVTDVSGRGVGMDVVRSNVRNLKGNVEIHSKLGLGTTFLIKLPASLMISKGILSKGILLEASGQEFILLLNNIRDMVKLPRDEAHRYHGMKLAQVRGKIYRVFTLAEILGLAETLLPEVELSVAIVEGGSVTYGLAVDRFTSEVEVLVKPLTGGLEDCREFQGAAIMGDGRMVLVLNALECHRLEQAACG